MPKRTVIYAVTASLLAAPVSAQSFDGAYRGSYVCEKTRAARGVLRVPLDLLVSGSTVRFGRPLFNLKGTRVIGTELAAGTIGDTGKMHLGSEFVVLGFSVQGAYDGTLDGHGGTFTGIQSWHWPDGRSGSRTCTAALVLAAHPSGAAPPEH